jgi:plasmid stability protein
MTMADSTTPDTRRTLDTRRTDDDALAAEIRRVRDEYADEEAEAAEREAAENAATLDVSLSLRISRDLDDALKRRSAEEQVSPSALARRLLRQALKPENQPVLTTRQVEEIARRIMRESA